MRTHRREREKIARAYRLHQAALRRCEDLEREVRELKAENQQLRRSVGGCPLVREDRPHVR